MTTTGTETTGTDSTVKNDRATVPSGPHAPSLVVGLATLLVAVLVALGVLGDVDVDAGAVLAVSLVVLGALLVVGGALSGLRGRSGR